jgi:hypothetical protein
VLFDLAVMLVDGGETISNLSMLAPSTGRRSGSVVPVPTAWRKFEVIDGAAPDPNATPAVPAQLWRKFGLGSGDRRDVAGPARGGIGR